METPFFIFIFSSASGFGGCVCTAAELRTFLTSGCSFARDPPLESPGGKDLTVLKSRIHSSETSLGVCADEDRPPCFPAESCSSGVPGEVHRTGDADDDQADDDGGNGHPLGVPPQPPGSFVVSIIVAVQRHDGEDQSHDVDRVRWAETRDNGEP